MNVPTVLETGLTNYNHVSVYSLPIPCQSEGNFFAGFFLSFLRGVLSLLIRFLDLCALESGHVNPQTGFQERQKNRSRWKNTVKGDSRLVLRVLFGVENWRGNGVLRKRLMTISENIVSGRGNPMGTKGKSRIWNQLCILHHNLVQSFFITAK